MPRPKNRRLDILFWFIIPVAMMASLFVYSGDPAGSFAFGLAAYWVGEIARIAAEVSCDLQDKRAARREVSA